MRPYIKINAPVVTGSTNNRQREGKAEMYLPVGMAVVPSGDRGKTPDLENK